MLAAGQSPISNLAEAATANILGAHYQESLRDC
jgi:hypothetical protein